MYYKLFILQQSIAPVSYKFAHKPEILFDEYGYMIISGMQADSKREITLLLPRDTVERIEVMQLKD